MFLPMWRKVFLRKTSKIMQFLGPKNGGPFLNLQPPAPVDLLRDGSFFFTNKTLVFYKLKWSHKGDGRLRETVWEIKIDCYIVRRRPRDLHAKSVADMHLELITPVLLFLFQKRTFHIIALIAEHFTALTSRWQKEGRKVSCNQNCFCSTGSLHKIN